MVFHVTTMPNEGGAKLNRSDILACKFCMLGEVQGDLFSSSSNKNGTFTVYPLFGRHQGDLQYSGHLAGKLAMVQ